MGISLEAVQRVALFADWNRHEIQEIARLFKEGCHGGRGYYRPRARLVSAGPPQARR
jgi:hypothetical protein